jgi:predicted negative regulator of RcsB-dependent stress response
MSASTRSLRKGGTDMMRRILIVIVLMGLSFAGGYWWERAKWSAAEAKSQTLSAQVSQANATIGLYRLQDQLLTLVQDTGNKNYGDAATLSTKFFDNLSAELTQTTQPGLRSALESIQNQRDAVTAGLAKADPKVHDLLVQLLDSFRKILGTPGETSV